MVGREDLPNAVALNSVIMNTSRVVGPAIGGIVIATVGLTACFFLNSVSYAAVVIALFAMNIGHLERQPTVAREKGQVRAGYRYVWSQPLLRAQLLMMAVIGTLAFNFSVLLPLFATRTFHLGAGGFGALTSALGIGAVLGGLGAASRHGVSNGRLVALAFAFGAGLVATAIAPSLAIALVALVVVGAFAFAYVATTNSSLQLSAAPEMRGRVMALYAVAFLGSTPIGAPIMGWIAQQFGVRAALLLSGIATVAAAYYGWHALHRKARQVEAEVAVPVAAQPEAALAA
jgi:predicted MFS family arabinose efflux permease